MADLKGLKVGDKVLMEGNPNLGVHTVIGTIENITLTGIYVVRGSASEYRFYDDGKERTGNKYNVRTARPLTEADIQARILKENRDRLARQFANAKDDLTNGQCEAIRAILAWETVKQ